MLKTGIFPDKLKKSGSYLYIKKMMKHPSQIIVQYHSDLPFKKSFKNYIYTTNYEQLYTHFQANQLLYNHQYGFREGHSIELIALEVVDREIHKMDNGETPFNIYLDLSKAFDTLDHSILTDRLKYYGIKAYRSKIVCKLPVKPQTVH